VLINSLEQTAASKINPVALCLGINESGKRQQSGSNH